jgi:hypothetical protein
VLAPLSKSVYIDVDEVERVKRKRQSILSFRNRGGEGRGKDGGEGRGRATS